MGELFTDKEIEYLLNRTEEDKKREEEDSEGDQWHVLIDPDTGRPFGVCVNERKPETEKLYNKIVEEIKRKEMAKE